MTLERERKGTGGGQETGGKFNDSYCVLEACVLSCESGRKNASLHTLEEEEPRVREEIALKNNLSLRPLLCPAFVGTSYRLERT